MLQPGLFAALYGFFLGGVFASFYGVVAERVPKRLSLGGRSNCACGRRLRASENVPILGWLATGGTARCCGASLPRSYLIAEIGGGLGVAAVSLLAGIAAGITVIALWGVVTVTVAMRRREKGTH